MSSSKRDKRTTPSRSNSNRSKTATINAFSGGKEDGFVVTPKIGPATTRKRYGIHNLGCLSQEGLLMSCCSLSILHFFLQMSIIYHQEYLYWNWEQVGVSLIAILNIFTSFSTDKKKESLMVILKQISKADNKWNVVISHFWSIVESDELNMVFPNVLIILLFSATMNSSISHVLKVPVIANGIITLLFINMKNSGYFMIKKMFSLGTWILGSTLAWPEEHASFLMEITAVLSYTLVASMFFSVMTPFCTVYTTAGALYIPTAEIIVSIVSFVLLVFPLLALYLVQIHRSQLYRYSRELLKFYNEQEASTLPLGDRLYGSWIRLVQGILTQEIRSISWTNGADVSFLSLLCVYSLTLQMIGVTSFSICYLPSLTFQIWMLGIEICIAVSVYLIVFHRPVYQSLDSSRAYSHSMQQQRQGITNEESHSSQSTSPPQEHSPDARHENALPSQNLQSLFSLDETPSSSNVNRPKDLSSLTSTTPTITAARTINCWAQVHSMQSLEHKQMAAKDLLSNLAETTTFQQLQSSARKSSTSKGNAHFSAMNKDNSQDTNTIDKSKALTSGLYSLSPTPSQSSLSMLQQMPLATLLTEKVSSVLISESTFDQNNSLTSSSDKNDVAVSSHVSNVSNDHKNNKSDKSSESPPTTTTDAVTATSFQPKQILKRAQPLTVEASTTASSTAVKEKDMKHPSPRHQGNSHNSKFSADNSASSSLHATVNSSSTVLTAAGSNNTTYKAKRFGSQQSTSGLPSSRNSSNSSNSHHPPVNPIAAVSHSSSSGGKLSIDVSSATLNGTKGTSAVHSQPNSPPYPSPSSVSSTSPGHPPVAPVPAVTIMSITHHHGGPITATSVTTTTTVPPISSSSSFAVSTSGTLHNTKSKHHHRTSRGPK